jgi:hypothetical protein
MSNVDQVENQVMGLNADDLKFFRNRFAEFDADAWDREIEVDLKSSALNSLADRALADYKAGRSIHHAAAKK